jgi:hypothetical protein
MITQYYPYQALITKTHYIFESVGEKGRVLKVVGFSPIENDVWNLGFGDLKEDGFVDGSVVTNNQDALKVIRTVAKVAIDFLALYPNYTLEINPFDEKRKRLYNALFQKYFEDIDTYFDILGTFEGKRETYTPSKIYDIFRITLKS